MNAAGAGGGGGGRKRGVGDVREFGVCGFPRRGDGEADETTSRFPSTRNFRPWGPRTWFRASSHGTSIAWVVTRPLTAESNTTSSRAICAKNPITDARSASLKLIETGD